MGSGDLGLFAECMFVCESFFFGETLHVYGLFLTKWAEVMAVLFFWENRFHAGEGRLPSDRSRDGL